MSLSSAREEIRLQGLGVSPGIAKGPARMLRKSLEEPDHAVISRYNVEAEKERLLRAIAKTRGQLMAFRDQLSAEESGSGNMQSEDAGIFDAHLLLLDDSTVLDEVVKLVEKELKTADWAYFTVIKRYVDSLRRISDPYMRERATDIEDVGQRVLRHLRWPGGDHPVPAVTGGGTAIVLAHDLTPSDTVAFDRNTVLGFATEGGSPTSHTAILARSLSIPAVVALHHFPDTARPGDTVLLDGYHGLVILNPNADTLREYEKLAEQESAMLSGLRKLKDAPTCTSDGRKIILSANIEFKKEIEELVEQGAEGIGLYRTEYFYINEENLRSEERQTEIYTTVAEAVAPHGVIIRTLDIGGDKLCPELFDTPEPNPFLGWRGIRTSLDRVDEFKDQLRAILRASARGKVGVMYPFLSNVDEVVRANAILDECREELRAKGVPFDEDMETGAMIEIPSAVLVADHIAQHVDFFSIGTNDLIQYTTAVDRVNDRVASLYRPAHPAVIKLLRETVEAAHRNGIWCGICGEAASDLDMTPVWVGLGVDELSVGSAQVLRTRRAISQLDSQRCADLVEEISHCARARDILKLCREMAEEAYPELLL